MAREWRTGILQTEKTKSSTLRERSQCATAPSPLRRQRGHASAMLLGEHEKRRRTRPSDRFARSERNRDFVRDWREQNACRGDQVVRGRGTGGRPAETGRLLAHGVARRNSAPQANACDWLGSVQARNRWQTSRTAAEFSGNESANARGCVRRHSIARRNRWPCESGGGDRKSTRLNSSHGYISYAVFCLKKKKNYTTTAYNELIDNAY